MDKPSEDELRILARMVQEPGRYFSPRAVESTTIVLRRMTEAGLVQMSLSKLGLPHYVITDAGVEAVLQDW